MHAYNMSAVAMPRLAQCDEQAGMQCVTDTLHKYCLLLRARVGLTPLMSKNKMSLKRLAMTVSPCRGSLQSPLLLSLSQDAHACAHAHVKTCFCFLVISRPHSHAHAHAHPNAHGKPC